LSTLNPITEIKDTCVCYFCVKLSSVDLKKPLDKEMAKLKEMRENQKEQVPGMLLL